MSVVVVDYAQGDVKKALFIMVLAGALQILLGALRLGSFVAYTPYPVVSGFTSAVGVIIIVVQLIPLLGHEVALGGVAASITALPDAISNIDTSAAALGILAIAVCLFWPRWLGRILRRRRCAAGGHRGQRAVDRRCGSDRRRAVRTARPGDAELRLG